MRPAWVTPEVGAFADHLGAQLLAVDPQRVVGGIADLRVRSRRSPCT